MSQWETVNSKKGNGKSKTKQPKIKYVDTIPKDSYEAAPLELSKSSFEALDKPKKVPTQKQPLQDQSNGQNSPKGGGKKIKKPKKPQPTSQFRYDNFEDAMQQFPVGSISARAKEIKGNSVWQKEIIQLVNDAISCPEEDATFSDRDNIDFPLCQMTQSAKDMMKQLYVSEASEQIRQIIFDHCMLSLWSCVEKDLPTWGYRLCIQVMARHAPQNCMDDLERHENKIRNGQNNVKKCLSYMWALGQIGVGDIRLGMKVWLAVMLPFLGTKKLSAYVVRYLESLFEMAKNPKRELAESIDAEQLVTIMMWTYDASNGLDAGLRNRLKSLFGTVRAIATGTKKLRLSLFQKFLRTRPDEIAKVGTPFVEIAWECSEDNPGCFEAWRTLYTSSLPQTRMLLEYSESKFAKRNTPTQLRETVCYFENCNGDAAASSSSLTSAPDFKSIRRLCQSFLINFEKRSTQKRSNCNMLLVSTLMVLVAIGAGIFIHDLKLHGNVVEKTVSYRMMKDSGTLDLLVATGKKVSAIAGYSVKWLQQHVPRYSSLIWDAFGPYARYFGLRLSEFGRWIVEASAPVRTVIASYAEQGLVFAGRAANKAWPYVADFANVAEPYLVSFFEWLDAKIISFIALLNGEYGWCCVRDSVAETATGLFEFFNETCLSLWSRTVSFGRVIGDYVSGENMN